MPEAVTFDLDDTLAVLDRDRGRILQETLAAVGAPPLSRAAYLAAHRDYHANRTREPIFDALLEKEGIESVDPRRLADEYRRRIRRSIAPVPGVDRMLDQLRSMMPIGLVTNGPKRAQLDKLDRLGWRDRFDAVVISGRLGAAKPDPTPFYNACDRLDVEPSRTVHVGDHPIHDVAGARRAGLTPILVGDAEIDADVLRIGRDALPTTLPTVIDRRIPS